LASSRANLTACCSFSTRSVSSLTRLAGSAGELHRLPVTDDHVLVVDLDLRRVLVGGLGLTHRSDLPMQRSDLPTQRSDLPAQGATFPGEREHLSNDRAHLSKIGPARADLGREGQPREWRRRRAPSTEPEVAR
jgi:hypothetical protein